MATHVAVVLDESGSMASIKHPTYTGFNEYIQDLRKDDSDEVFVTLTKFNFSASVIYANKPLNEVPLLTQNTYVPNGGTALYDAISFTVAELQDKVKKNDRAVVVVMTDGHENSSKETNQQQVLDLIKAKEAEDNWTFAYLGANQDAWSVGNTMGFSRGNTMTYVASAAGVTDTYTRLASSTSNLRNSDLKASASFLSNDDADTKGRTKGSTDS